MIKLKKLEWSNCFSYGEGNYVELDNNTLTQVLGSNGVGKSSIPLILEEVLYNKNSKGVKKADIPNRNVGSGYSIALDFEKNEVQYRVEVVRKASVKVKLYENGEDISSHTATNTYKTLQEIIGIDFKTFSQIVYQNTNSSLQFLTATDTNRKRFLIDLLNLDDYLNYFEICKAAAKDAADELAHIEGRCDTIENWLKNNKLTSSEVQPLLNLPNGTDEYENELSTLLSEIKNISLRNREISKNNEYKQMLANIDIELLRQSEYTEEKSYDSKQKELGRLNSEVSRLKQAVKKMESLGSVCPTCEQEINSSMKESLIDADRDLIARYEEEAKDVEAEVQGIKEHNRKVKEVQGKIQEWQNLFRSIDNDVPSELLNETDLKGKANKLSAQIKELKKEAAEINAENQKRAAHNSRIEVIQEQTQEFTEQLESLEKDLKEVQELSSSLEILKKSFSTNGLVAYKIENLVEELEEITNTYLAELSDGRFTLEFVVSNDKLNVEITDNGKQVDIMALSSGELARVNTSTLLAIRKLMNSISSSQINVLFLDEVINVLDEQGREKIVEVLLEEDLNTFIVSHQWTHPLLEKLEITKDNVSRIEHG